MSKPIKLSAGCVHLKIYVGRWRGKATYEVRDHWGRKTNRKKFTSKPAAQIYAQARLAMMANGASAKFRLSDTQAFQLEQAIEILKPTGKTVLQIAYEEIARWKVESKLRLADSPFVSIVLQQFLQEKRHQQLSAYHLRDLQTRLGRFAADFKLPINRVRHEELETWLNGLKVGARTWNNYRAALAGLFAFAKERKFLAADWAELDALKAVDLSDAEPMVYTPKEFRRILESATPERFQILLAICAFAGIRSEEVCKLKWEDFDWTAGLIVMRKGIVKGRASQRHQRQVPISDNLAEWLAPHRHNTGPVSPYKNPKVVAGMKTKLAVKLGIRWTKNGLRKSWISYQLALVQIPGKVAYWAGNSEKVIKDTYEKLVTAEAAREWFEIRPTTVTQGILKLDFAPKRA